MAIFPWKYDYRHSKHIMVRMKNRYLLCELVKEDGTPCSHRCTDHKVYVTIRDALQKAHGDLGMAVVKKSLNVKYMNSQTGIIMVRVSRGAQHYLQTTLPFIKSIEDTTVSFKSLHMAGTIRSCQKFLIKYHRQQLMILLKSCTDPHVRRNITQSLKDIRKLCD